MALKDKFLNRQGLGHFWNHIVARINKHIENTDNPHKVTLAKLGFSSPDCDQNDSTALDYIKNRPFYSIKTEIYDDREKAYNFDGVSVSFELEVGKHYVVSINETEHETICEASSYNGSEAKKIDCGDYAIYIANGLLYLTYPDGEDNATVAIKIVLDDIKKLDKKYLPDDIGGGGTSIDVTAEVGQTIIVKEVDANGKPTSWESADYQPRTHWDEIILPETTLELDEEGVAYIPQGIAVNTGDRPTIIYNGTEYVCSVMDLGEGAKGLGNLGLVAEGLPTTNDPFAIICESDGVEEFWGFIPLDGSPSVTLSVKKSVPIPQKYLANAMPYYKVILGGIPTTEDVPCSETWDELYSIIKNGRDIKIKVETEAGLFLFTCEGASQFSMVFTSRFAQEIGFNLYINKNDDGTCAISVNERKS